MLGGRGQTRYTVVVPAGKVPEFEEILRHLNGKVLHFQDNFYWTLIADIISDPTLRAIVNEVEKRGGPRNLHRLTTLTAYQVWQWYYRETNGGKLFVEICNYMIETRLTFADVSPKNFVGLKADLQAWYRNQGVNDDRIIRKLISAGLIDPQLIRQLTPQDIKLIPQLGRVSWPIVGQLRDQLLVGE